MNDHVRVNIRSTVNSKKIRRERRNGRDYIVVPSATLPDDIVMNGIRYPADEIEKSYHSLENSPAPLGHPDVEGMFVSARDPEGLARGWVGAWNKNVRRENGRVFLDKVIDVATASQLEGGKSVLNAIEKGEPIHTSTGLFCVLENTDGEEKIARDIVFDHDAILLGEDGAATPDQGVGIFVNSSGEREEVEVINSALDLAEDELDWAGMHMLSALERRERASTWERMKSALLEAITGSERGTATNKGEEAMDKGQFDDLSGKLDKLAESMEGMGDTITNALTGALKPLTDNLEQIQNAQKAKEDEERGELVKKVVNSNLLTEDSAKELPMPALRELANKATPGRAHQMNGSGQPTGGGESGGFKLPAESKGA